MSRLVIIRGNSGSGKTSLAQAMQDHFKDGCLVISQDLVRRQMLREFGQSGTLTVPLVEEIAGFGYRNGLTVILEGFYERDKYGEMLTRLKSLFGEKVLSYYYDLSFEETVKRHQTREKRHEFTADDMKRWWKDKDYLEWENEILITDDIRLEEVLLSIVQKLEDL